MLVITGEREIHVSHEVHLSEVLLLKGAYGGFGHVSGAAFTMCCNPNKVISIDNSP